jgi:hypothetical protein
VALAIASTEPGSGVSGAALSSERATVASMLSKAAIPASHRIIARLRLQKFVSL